MSISLNIPERFTTPLAVSPKGKPVYLIGGGDGTTPIPPAAPDNSAQNPDEKTPPVGQGDTFFTQADIDAAIERTRKQEKDKLYSKLDTATAQIAELKKAEEDRLKALAEEQKAKAAAEKAAAEAEMSAKQLLDKREAEFNARLENLNKEFDTKLSTFQQEREQERALFEKNQQFAELQAYTQKRLSEEQANIAPELVEFINGSSRDEIEASIDLVKTKSAQMADQVRAAIQQTQTRTPGTRVSGYGPQGMEFQSGDQKFSPEDIRNMDMKTFAEFRQKMGIGGVSNSRGLFG